MKKEESPPPVRLSSCPGLGLGLAPMGKEVQRRVPHFDVGPLILCLSQTSINKWGTLSANRDITGESEAVPLSLHPALFLPDWGMPGPF